MLPTAQCILNWRMLSQTCVKRANVRRRLIDELCQNNFFFVQNKFIRIIVKQKYTETFLHYAAPCYLHMEKRYK